MSVHVAETHTGLVFLVGDQAYKVKKPVVTDFLDFSTIEARERACAREVSLNSRLSPASYLGVGHFTMPQGGRAEPVIVMRRHRDEDRLATLVRGGADVTGHLTAIAAALAGFHAAALRGPQIDEQGRPAAVAARWRENLDELDRYAGHDTAAREGVPDPAEVVEIRRLAERYLAGRAALFDGRIAAGRIVDGHADLLADDIFCLPGGPALLDCLEFDDRLRYVDVVDDAAFLAMDLAFLGRPDLGEYFLNAYLARTGDDAPASLLGFYGAYRAVVRAKVDCVRISQGHREAAADADRHLQIALSRLRAAAVRLILVGGAPGTGKTTLATALAERIGAEVVSTDDVRAGMVASGEITGRPGVLGEGLYSPANIAAVYDETLRRARLAVCGGRSVVLDGTWADPHQRDLARTVAAGASASLVELACAAPPDAAADRIRSRTATTSQVTPDIAGALADRGAGIWPEAHRIDTTRPLGESVTEAGDICLAAC